MSALIASLFAVGAAPAAALDEKSKPNAPAATSACVGDATDDMMFSDVSEMNVLRAEINCLAYYGVTIGYGDGNFGPNDDVTRGQMVLFMERAAAVAGADAEAVLGDFAMSGSDPVHRADMALLIARLLVSATNDESPVNVKNAADGTFTVVGVAAKDWDYFADSRRSQNRVSDSAASALYELGVAKGTGMGYFSPAASVSRDEMAAFITRALAHTSARPAGVSIQSDEAGGVIVSVRDANFHPVANAAVDVFSADADKVGEAFNADGTCNKPRVDGVGGNATVCEIDALDAITGLNGDYDPGAVTVNVKAGGTTVWAWTGDVGDKVADGGEGLAHVTLTAATPTQAVDAKITTDPGIKPGTTTGVDRAAFGSTVTVTIQLVGAATARADAVPPTGGASYTVRIETQTFMNAASDDLTVDPPAVATATTVSTQTVAVDASGKGTFTITAADPDPNDADDTAGASVDYVTVTYNVVPVRAAPTIADAISSVDSSGNQTIRFSDAPSVVRGGGSVTPAVAHLAAPVPTSGSAANVVTVKVVDQYGKPVRGAEVTLSGHANSTFPTARRTDSSGTVRIGYRKTGAGVVETLTATTTVDNASVTIGTAMFYWTAAAEASTTATPTSQVGMFMWRTLIGTRWSSVIRRSQSSTTPTTSSLWVVPLARWQHSRRHSRPTKPTTTRSRCPRTIPPIPAMSRYSR